MARKKPARANKPWTSSEIKTLEKLAKGNTPTPLIAYKMDRSEASIYNKAAAEKISLKPTNKPPYG